MIFELFVAATVAITVFSVLFSAPLYIAVMVIIIKYRRKPPFNSSFYSIFLASGVVDLICYLLYALIKKPIFWGIIYPPYDGFDKPNLAAKLSLLTIWLFALLQYEYMCLLTLNRFVGICLPDFYFKYWTPTNNRFLIGVPIVLVLALLYPCVHADYAVSEYEIFFEGTFRKLHGGPTTITSSVGQYFFRIWAIHVYALMFGGVLLYTIMYVKARVLYKAGSQATKNRLELKMLKQGAMLFVLNVCFCAVFFVRGYLSEANSHLYEYILFVVSDIYDLSSGLILFLTSTEIRRKLRNIRTPGNSFAIPVKTRSSALGADFTSGQFS
ncbi:unnamed protein product [Bursaphelenchus xylophilus]|uniref:(pine wood nematode) hypothetical protein n=1 Tax=Bursaphelenchus xylophilus TaxID=6326 RepID=A0A1I7SUM2_BURXY|nr:unnamed protein product [Bursaphelenchus xylophilus]CAG9118567.1 unnamed protein product [Bursaphelenchus xylophilus]